MDADNFSDDDAKKSIFGIGEILSCALIIFGVYLVVATVIRLIGLGHASSNFKQTTGTVDAIQSATVNREAVCQLTYTFEVDGDSFTSSTSASTDNTDYYNADNCRKVRGQNVTVIYNPADPTVNRPDATSNGPAAADLISDIGPIPLGALLIAIGVFALKLARRAHDHDTPDVSELAEANYLEQISRDPYKRE